MGGDRLRETEIRRGRELPERLPSTGEDILSALLRDYPRLTGRVRGALIQKLGLRVRHYHDAGQFGSWWVGCSLRACSFPDAEERPGGSIPGRRLREKNLVLACREMEGFFRRSDLLRFLRGYLGGITDSNAREFIFRVFRRFYSAPHRRLPGRRFFADSDLVSAARKGKLHFLTDRTEESEVLAALLQGNANSVLSGSTLMPGRGSRSQAVRIELAGKFYFLKVFQGGRGVLRSRARSVWLFSWWLRLNGIPVPRPYLLREGAATEAWLLTEFAEGYCRLSDRWQQAGPVERKQLMIRSAILLGRLHCLGWIHGDFNWNNILVGPKGDLLLVDLDCSKPLGFFADHRRIRDVQHFLRDLLRPENQGEQWKGLFLSVWRRWSGVDMIVPSWSVM